PCRPFGFGYRRGEPVAIRIVVVNDDPALAGAASLRWSVARDRGPEGSPFGRVRDALQRKSFSGAVEFELPTSREPAAQVTSLSLPLVAEGGYRVEVELFAGGKVVDSGELQLQVAEQLPSETPAPPMPAF